MSRFTKYFPSADYKTNKIKTKKILLKLLESDIYKTATKNEQNVMLHICRNIMASPNFTDFQSSRKAAAELGISKSFYCQTRQLLLKSELFIEYRHNINVSRVQILIRPLGLKGEVAFVNKSHADHDYYYSRVFKYRSMSNGEFIEFLNSGHNKKKSKTGLVPCLSRSSQIPVNLIESNAIFTNFRQNSKIPMAKYGYLKKLPIESRQINEKLDIGVYLQGGLVCLDADNAETFQVLSSILPDNVLKQKNLTSGHGHIIVRDKENLLKQFNKIGNVDLLYGNRAVRIKCKDYSALEGDIININLEMVNNILLYCGNGEILLSAKIKNKKYKRFDNVGETLTGKIANNVLDVLKGSNLVKYRLEEGNRNNTLHKVLCAIRAKGYTKEIIKSAAELFGKQFIVGTDDKASGTLKSVLRGKNKAGFNQYVAMFSKEL
jgi:hypothetical protein